MSAPKKRKLTLTVDNDVIEKAKEIGLNLSDITEKVLRGFAFSATAGGESAIREKYKELFATIRPLLREYDIRSVVVGEDYAEDDSIGHVTLTDFSLGANGKLIDDGDNEVDLETLPLTCLYEPKKILANFITELSDARQKSKEKVEELEMAKRIILAMSEKLAPKQKSGGGRGKS
jgi:hypothetical protein